MRPFESFWQDIRMAIRVLRKSPGATGLSILSIALGIGLTTGIFSVGDAMLLRPFPLERPGEVFQVTSLGDDGQPLFYGWADYQDMLHAGAGLRDIVAYQRRGAMLATGEDTEMVLAYPVTPNFFTVLGVQAALGRATVEQEGGRPGVVIGYRLWQRRFGGDPHTVGKTILLSRQAFVVTGIMPMQFGGLVRGVSNDVWLSMDAWFDVLGNKEEKKGRNGQFEFVTRLEPGVRPERAAAQLDAVIRGPGKHKPAPGGSKGTFLEASFAPGWRASLIFGGGLALVLGLVLFVACVNVAQLRLAQSETRKKELGVRMALGAGPRRVARQLLTETGLISLTGCALGLWLAQSLMAKVAEFLSAAGAYIDAGIRMDFRVLAFTLAAALASVLLAGLAPARHAMRLDVTEVLKSEQGIAGARGGRQRKVFMAGQVAVSVMLFGLGQGPPTLWCEQACERLAGLPGVRGATYARRLPLSGSGGGATVRVEIPGHAPLGLKFNNVGGNYFSLMGTRVVAGRGIDANDREGSPLVVVVSQRFARQVFANRNPLGEWISVEKKKRQIVGVAEDGPSNYLHQAPEPYVYLPFAQETSDDITLMVETAGNPERLERAIRHELKQFDPRSVVYEAATLRQQMQQALLLDRLMVMLTTLLGAFGFLLTAAGLFGVIQYAVNRRTREIGLRVALGAGAPDIRSMVLHESLRVAAWGIGAGLLLLAAVAWSVRSMVLGVTPLSPVLYGASSVVAVFLALLAAWWPARRATRVDPMAALRSE